MATYNANTVREEARLEELANCVEERGVEILGVQEHRRVHTDQPILYHKVGGCSFITSSAWRNDAQAATGGVGLMVSPRARRALRRVQQHTNRILVADFEGNPVTTVMSVYSPTNAAPIEDVEKFYDELRTAIHHVPAHNFLVILGDFNARLGPEDAPFTYHNNTNRNGEYLSALLTEHELLAANTLFRKRMGKRWTFQDRASGMLRQLDYILEKAKGALIRARFTSMRDIDAPTTFFFNLERSVGQRKQMVCLRLPDGQVTSEPAEMRRHAVSFYTDLFKAEGVTGSSMTFRSPQLSPAESDTLGSDITLEELTSAVTQMASGKAPGIDGLPADFFKHFGVC
ncbi:hypothetical protein NHX12_025574 [Muraenolepis orangiensis]|uniref:Endonuclease/exonuclease/phosphatase domain-containing protein n=1 Tax=Muraenolepis orangiensis TaxID=630683 RepID=A0A9Q0EIH3_9TELE|nr:hypothetical protein NHX12_025574 [Muraenolepis orangiensis]